MVATKGAAAASANWEGAISRVGAAYQSGVQNTTNWQANAIAAEDLWKQKIAEAASKNARAAGIQKVSDADWQKASLDKGAQRIGPGMTAAKDKFSKGISGVIAVIEGVTIAPRTADPMANIDNRVKPIAAALAAKKGTF